MPQFGAQEYVSAPANLASGRGTPKHRLFSEQWSVRPEETYPHHPKIGTRVTKIISSCFPLPTHLALIPPPLQEPDLRQLFNVIFTKAEIVCTP